MLTATQRREIELLIRDASSGECLIAADAIIAELEASGRSIVHKDDIHAPSDAVVETALTTWFGADLPWHTGLSNAVVEQCIAAMRDTIAAALRELMKEAGE